MYEEGLSILIPVFNRPCGTLVRQLHEQAVAIGTAFEMIVIEDGSTDRAAVEQNSSLERLEGVRHIVHPENRGRAAVRNALADEARFATLLFLDCDMEVRKTNFLQCYLREKAPVVCGGIRIGGDAHLLRYNLRYRYEKAFEKRHPQRCYKDDTCMDFHTANFLIDHRVMDTCRFDERFRRYGYEDVRFGKTLQQASIPVSHIDNPVWMTQYEPNASFLAKTEEAMRTLYDFRSELRSHSRLLKQVERLKHLGLLPFLRIMHRSVGGILRKNLSGPRPTHTLFNVYKLLYYAALKIQT